MTSEPPVLRLPFHFGGVEVPRPGGELEIILQQWLLQQQQKHDLATFLIQDAVLSITHGTLVCGE